MEITGATVRTARTEPVAGTRADVGQVAVPDRPDALRQSDVDLGAVDVEQTQLDLARCVGEHREVGPGSVPGRAEWFRPAGPDTHRCSGVDHPDAPARATNRSRERSISSDRRRSSSGTHSVPP